jgi:hypothetical protein
MNILCNKLNNTGNMKTVKKKRSFGLELKSLPLVILQHIVLLSRHVVFAYYVKFAGEHMISKLTFNSERSGLTYKRPTP